MEIGDSFLYLPVKSVYAHPFLGQLSLINVNENKAINLLERPLMYRIEISNYEPDEVFRKIFHQGLKFNHHNYMSPLHFANNDRGTSLLIETFDADLRTQLKLRQKDRVHFSEGELWGMAGTLIEAISFLHEFETHHGNIGPATIVLNNFLNLKLISPHLICLKKMEKDAGNESKRKKKIVKEYMCPDEFMSLKYKETTKFIDKFKSDVFALGLTLLESATLVSVTSCYNWDTYLINYEFVLRKIIIVEKRYSKELAYLIKLMLNVVQEERPTIFELSNFFRIELAKRKGIQVLLPSIATNSGAFEKAQARRDNICNGCCETLVEKYASGVQPSIFSKTDLPCLGAEINSNGGYYEGDWKDGFMDGFGKLFKGNGDLVYEGQFKRDMKHGRGVLHNQSVDEEIFEGSSDLSQLKGRWVKYEGDFFEDMKQGVGRLTLNNGDYYEGQFYRDMIEGKGVLKKENGDFVRGTWRKNVHITE